MTEATFTDAEYEAAEIENLLRIPWFLDVKNPENIKRRAELLAARLVLKASPKRLVKLLDLGKQVITKPEKVIEVPVLIGEPGGGKTAIVNGPAPRKGKLNDDAIIRVLVSKFGHKPGSKAETKSAGLRDGMTVAEYMADDLGISGKWHTSHLSHCVGKNFIKLED